MARLDIVKRDQTSDFEDLEGWGDDQPAGEEIAYSVVAERPSRWSVVFQLGGVLWHIAGLLLLVMAGFALHHGVLMLALGSGIFLLALKGLAARGVGWLLWGMVVSGSYLWLYRIHPKPAPWWIEPVVVTFVILCADILSRWGQARHGRRPYRPH